MPDFTLPASYIARPARARDLEAAVDLFNTCSRDLVGRPLVTVTSQRNDWATPSFSLETDTRCVFTTTGDLVGYGEVWDAAPHTVIWSWGRIHPAHRGRGIGSHLVDWEERRARDAIRLAPQDARVTLRQGLQGEAKDAQALLASHGYHVIRHFHKMVIELTEPPSPPTVPKNIAVRSFNRAADLPGVIHADQAAFRDHWGFVVRPFKEELTRWTHMIDDDPDFDPSLWFLAMDGDEIAGLCLGKGQTIEDPEMGWIQILGVRRPWRRQGLGLALLHQAFGEFHRRGRQRVGLVVDADSLTGATRLYERAGMQMQSITHTYEKELRPGNEVGTQTAARGDSEG